MPHKFPLRGTILTLVPLVYKTLCISVQGCLAKRVHCSLKVNKNNFHGNSQQKQQGWFVIDPVIVRKQPIIKEIPAFTHETLDALISLLASSIMGVVT